MAPKEAGSLVRFDGVERAVHWATAVLFLTLVVTGAALYVPPLVALVGRRALLVRAHVDAGLALPLPLLIGVAGPWGRALRADLRRLNRWSEDDGRWLSLALRRLPRSHLRVGKFNAGQKLNAAASLGVMGVMLMTGSIMRWFYFWPLSWRSGATFVHELVAYLFVAVVLAHLYMALTHPHALKSIFTGRVSRAWAERNAKAWAEELAALSCSQGAVASEIPNPPAGEGAKGDKP